MEARLRARGRKLAWPVGLGGKGNEGVAGQVKQTPGAIGYVELAYAKQNHARRTQRSRMQSGEFVEPSIESATAAAAAVGRTLSADVRLPPVDRQRGGHRRLPDLVVHLAARSTRRSRDATKGKQLADFLRWCADRTVSRAPRRSTTPRSRRRSSRRCSLRVDSISKVGARDAFPRRARAVEARERRRRSRFASRAPHSATGSI